MLSFLKDIVKKKNQEFDTEGSSTDIKGESYYIVFKDNERDLHAEVVLAKSYENALLTLREVFHSAEVLSVFKMQEIKKMGVMLLDETIQSYVVEYVEEFDYLLKFEAGSLISDKEDYPKENTRIKLDRRTAAEFYHLFAQAFMSKLDTTELVDKSFE